MNVHRGTSLLSPGAIVELRPEKPVVGGRMLARVEGEVVLVSGTIPGERVSAAVERRQQGVWFARTVSVLDASPDRRDPGPDPLCGGMSFAHVAYGRQCELKSAMLIDAMARIGRVTLDVPPALTASPVSGYRMRYRVHSGAGTLGFFREGTHAVCDPASSGQLAPESLGCLAHLAARLPLDASSQVEAFEWLENLPNTERVVHLAMRSERPPSSALLDALAKTDGVTGVSWSRAGRARVVEASGSPRVSDPISAFLGVSAVERGEVVIGRGGPSFFQANRFLTPVLAQKVVSVVDDGPVVDLYAGVGLFALCLVAAARGGDRSGHVTAIENDAASARDLEENAAQVAPRLRVVRSSVEEFLARENGLSNVTLIVDPPRAGMSRVAVQRVLDANARRIVYVSCDVATLARDTRRLLDRGYVLDSLEALDLFPNTAHVEGFGVFDRRAV